MGGYFKSIAQADSVPVSQFINDRVADVNALAAETSIVDAITTSNHSHARMSEEALAAHIEKIERDWDAVGSKFPYREIVVIAGFSLATTAARSS